MLLALAGCARRPQAELQQDQPPPPEAPEVATDVEGEADPPAASDPAEQRRRRAPRARLPEGVLEAYKAQLARHIAGRATSRTFDGPPPALLRSVVVLSLVVDASGNLAGTRVLRDNGDADTVRIALESAREAAPFPPLPAGLGRRGRVAMVETWLFRADGRFQLRSLAAAPQRGE